MSGLDAMREQVPLGPLTTLELGGPARYYIETDDARLTQLALAFAAEQDLDVAVLGGGSNLIVADQGFDGLVIRQRGRGLTSGPGPEGKVRVSVEAGRDWDEVVTWAVGQGLGGIECLAGIPGTVGAAPIQNVGAYGQEIGDVIESVRVIDRHDLELRALAHEACQLGYRSSLFRRLPDRYVVVGVSLLLTPGARPAPRYPELERAVAARLSQGTDGVLAADLALVRETVLDLRRGKSMVVEPDNPNRRSVGSFFINPVLDPDEITELERRAVACGAVTEPGLIPRFSGGGDLLKVPAAWLIQAVGFRKGERRGPVGISSDHVLALVHHGGGTSVGLLELAAEIRGRVAEMLGIELRLEPVLLGFGRTSLPVR